MSRGPSFNSISVKKEEQTSSTHCEQTWCAQYCADAAEPLRADSRSTFFSRRIAQSAPVAVAIISRTKSNYDQFGFARIRTNIKRFALKFGARCMGCVPISRLVLTLFVHSAPQPLLTFSLSFLLFHCLFTMLSNSLALWFQSVVSTFIYLYYNWRNLENYLLRSSNVPYKRFQRKRKMKYAHHYYRSILYKI